MENRRIWAIYFSPTHATGRVTETVAASLAEALGATVASWDFTLPGKRQSHPDLRAGDVAVVGVPTYAGLVPALIQPWLEALKGRGIPVVAVVTYGNRDFDDALIQLRDLLQDGGFLPFAAGAFVGEHSFSRTLAAGRPDGEDLDQARQLGGMAARRLEGGELALVEVSGVPRPYRGRYQPRDRQGRPVNFSQAQPLTGDGCNHCGLCALLCPAGAIDPADLSVHLAPCIKCGACVKACPQNARYFDHPDFLAHTRQLEEDHTRRGEVKLF